MERFCAVLWADCIRALRRAGFVCAAESSTAVMLVNAGRSVFLLRVPALDQIALQSALRATRLDPEEFLALLWEDQPSAPSRARLGAFGDEIPPLQQDPDALE